MTFSEKDTIENDDLYQTAVLLVRESKIVSISYIQRKLKIGYNRAARLVEAMEYDKVIGNCQSDGKRDVLPVSSKNDYGLDVPYMTKKLEGVLRDINVYRPGEIARELVRIASAADTGEALKEAKRLSHE